MYALLLVATFTIYCLLLFLLMVLYSLYVLCLLLLGSIVLCYGSVDFYKIFCLFCLKYISNYFAVSRNVRIFA